MLMRNPEYKIEDQVGCKRRPDEAFVVQAPRELLLGQIVLMLLLVIAILLRAMV